MACSFEFEPKQCIVDHWERTKSLDGGQVGEHWRFRCPVCGKAACLEATPKPSGIVYRCWYVPPGSKKQRPGCATEDIRAALAEVLPCWKGRKPRRAAIDRDELVGLLLDKSLPPNALRVAALRSLGMPEAQIRSQLKLPKRTYYDAVNILVSRPKR